MWVVRLGVWVGVCSLGCLCMLAERRRSGMVHCGVWCCMGSIWVMPLVVVQLPGLLQYVPLARVPNAGAVVRGVVWWRLCVYWIVEMCCVGSLMPVPVCLGGV